MNMHPSDTELTEMLRTIAHAEATRYYKVEEANPSPLVVKSVFMLIVAAVTIAFVRSGVDEERLNSLGGLVEEVTHEMQLVGWKFEGMADLISQE